MRRFGGISARGISARGVTGRGVGVIGAAVVLLFIGFRFGYPDLALLGTAAAVAVASGVVFAVWRPGLGVERVAEPDRVARGEPANMTLTVRNTSRLRAANLVAVDRCGAASVPVPLLRLRPGRDTTVVYPVPTRRRGVVPVGPLRVTRGDPLGLMTLSRTYGDATTVWVHPRIHLLRAVPAGMARSLDGRIDKVPQGTITFDSLREYVYGDELRRVHWRSSAKVGELMVREQLDTSEPTIIVLLDDRAAAHPHVKDGTADSFEAACEAAASIVAAAAREDLPVALHLVSGPAPGTFLDVLTEAGLRGGDLTQTLRSLRQNRLGDTLVYLTGPGGRADLGAVTGLRGAYPVVIAGLFGDPDAAPVTTGGGLIVIEAEDGAQFAGAWDGVRGW
ncbi:DUF58 domain-containing protein [Amorphoplanes digitatis]|uniref:Uncharacterized protein (DUF58 family) n=1 Tax=Actinoplanes digitatis TaxID=1868 RepID=A0A7W7MSA9_9ACTN|nr:DUF58 domain-containing protein [Actinoplanes digitatis]MBB4765143.1 uncharacterized protein (DUF58 family) [Actinoplanes digitatis]BFE74878.1 hypothetical protein GCM10020092_081790 [Actinoplanes digitatis]GID98078.1 hypothetical protein Adi01nite_74900 [Actinoplanes digitatis]